MDTHAYDRNMQGKLGGIWTWAYGLHGGMELGQYGRLIYMHRCNGLGWHGSKLVVYITPNAPNLVS